MENSIKKTAELSEWVRLYTNEMFAWAYQKTADQELSEDLVQDTFLAASERINSFKNKSEPKTWLFGILKNKIADHYRKSLRQNKTSLFTPEQLSTFFGSDDRWHISTRPVVWAGEPEHLLDVPDFNRIFDGCIENLPKAMHACIRLKFIEEKKGQQICEELGFTSTNYWQLIRRAKLQLRACLEQGWFTKNA